MGQVFSQRSLLEVQGLWDSGMLNFFSAYFTLSCFCYLKLMWRVVLFLPHCFEKSQMTVPPGPLMSLPLMHVFDLFARLEIATLGHLRHRWQQQQHQPDLEHPSAVA